MKHLICNAHISWQPVLEHTTSQDITALVLLKNFVAGTMLTPRLDT
jgi:hypothetical protein